MKTDLVAALIARAPAARAVAFGLLGLLGLAALLGGGAARGADAGFAINGNILAVIGTASPAVTARIALGSAGTGALVADPVRPIVHVAAHDYIAVVDTLAGNVVATLPAGNADLLAVVPSGRFVYAAGRLSVAGSASQPQVAVLDTRSAEVVATLPLASTARVTGVVVVAGGTKVYAAHSVTGCCEGVVSVFDAVRHVVVTEIPLVIGGRLVAEPGGRRAWAVTTTGLTVIDTTTDAIVQKVDLQGPTPYPPIVVSDIAFDPGGKWAYVAAYAGGGFFGGYDGRILVLDTDTRAVVATIALEQIPSVLAIDEDGRRLYASGWVPGPSARPSQLRAAGVAAIDTAQRTVLGNVPPVSPAAYTPAQGSLAVAPGGRGVYATDSATVYVVDPVSLKMIATLPPEKALLFAASVPSVPEPDWFYVLDPVSGTTVAAQWGAPGDLPVPADYDGDGRADFAVLRPREAGEEAVWWIRRSSDGGVVRQQWGSITLGDVPVPAPYSGARRAEIAVWRPVEGGWYIRHWDGGITNWRFGIGTDLPVPADFDGDGKVDLATYHDGNWLIFGSRVGVVTAKLGTGTEVPVPADYDGDGTADLAVYQPATGRWQIRLSGTGALVELSLGAPGDTPVPADYDGDGRADPAVFRPATGTWTVRESRSGKLTTVVWGAAGDAAVPRTYVGGPRADFAVYRP